MRIKPKRISWESANSFYKLESKDIVAVLEKNGVQVKNISPAGSLRRGRKTIGDLDIVIEVDNPHLAGNVLEDRQHPKVPVYENYTLKPMNVSFKDITTAIP